MLAGEYAVLAPGGQALTLATAPFCAVLFWPGTTYASRGARGDWLPWPAPGVPLDQLPQALRLPYCLPEAAALLGLPLRPPAEVGHLEVRWLAQLPSEPRPQGRGLPGFALVPPAAVVPPCQLPALLATPLHQGPRVGSSAALTVALALALLPESHRAFALPLALAAHRLFQGGGSGYDVAACFAGGASTFLQGASAALPATLAPGLELAWQYTGVKASTARLLANPRRGSPTDHPALLEAHARTSRDLIHILCAQAPAAGLPQAVAAANATLAALDTALGGSILTPAVTAALAVLTDRGFHAKVSGAGGGDFVVGFRLTPNQDLTKLPP
jgi:mevalonate kinase